MKERLPSIALSALLAAVLFGAGCGDGGSGGGGPAVTAGAAGQAQGVSGAAATEGVTAGGAGRDSASDRAGAESATGGSKDNSCDPGTERCRCFGNGTCYGLLTCLSGFCVDTGSGTAGGFSDTAPGGAGGRGGAQTNGNHAGAGGAPHSEPIVAGAGPVGVAGAAAASGGGPAGAGGAENGGQAGSSSVEGGTGGVEPAATAGTAGSAGAAGGPCLELLTSEAAFDAATSNLTVGTEDFALDADGAAITDFAVAHGDHFYHHHEVTFESVATSDQADPGTRSDDVVTLEGNGISSMIGSYTGFDGIAMLFASAQTAVGFSVTQAGTAGFTLAAVGSDGSVVGALAVPATGPYFAAAVSHCGDVIQSLEIKPNRSETGEHHSQFWRLAWVKYAR
jgi:hypothetical protein